MPAMVIYYGPGPLPVVAEFESPSDGDAMFILSGTAYTENAANLTGIALILDGNPIGSPATCWANENNNHTAMMPIYIPVELSGPKHIVEIVNANGNTITDVNDYVQLILTY